VVVTSATAVTLVFKCGVMFSAGSGAPTRLREKLREIGRSAVDVIEGSVRKRAGGDRPPEIRIEHLGCFDDVGLPDIA
jgi:hypothetical protein